MRAQEAMLQLEPLQNLADRLAHLAGSLDAGVPHQLVEHSRDHGKPLAGELAVGKDVDGGRDEGRVR